MGRTILLSSLLSAVFTAASAEQLRFENKGTSINDRVFVANFLSCGENSVSSSYPFVFADEQGGQLAAHEPFFPRNVPFFHVKDVEKTGIPPNNVDRYEFEIEGEISLSLLSQGTGPEEGKRYTQELYAKHDKLMETNTLPSYSSGQIDCLIFGLANGLYNQKSLSETLLQRVTDIDLRTPSDLNEQNKLLQLHIDNLEDRIKHLEQIIEEKAQPD